MKTVKVKYGGFEAEQEVDESLYDAIYQQGYKDAESKINPLMRGIHDNVAESEYQRGRADALKDKNLCPYDTDSCGYAKGKADAFKLHEIEEFFEATIYETNNMVCFDTFHQPFIPHCGLVRIKKDGKDKVYDGEHFKGNAEEFLKGEYIGKGIRISPREVLYFISFPDFETELAEQIKEQTMSKSTGNNTYYGRIRQMTNKEAIEYAATHSFLALYEKGRADATKRWLDIIEGMIPGFRDKLEEQIKEDLGVD